MIRKAENKDINSIQFLFGELTGHEISIVQVQNRLDFVNSSQIDSLFVYELDDKIIGLLGFRIRENIEENSRFGEVSLIVVDPKYRKNGVGRQLIDYAESLADSYNCIGTWLVSGFGREEQAHNFYKSLGYITTGYRFVKLRL